MSAIEVSSLTKAYGHVHAVDAISFSVRRGEVFSLLGPNGAGKTTTIEILEGLRKKDGGQVSVLGMDPWEKGGILHSKIGVMPQGFKFFEKITPREAIRYYATLFGATVDAESILKEVLLEDSGDTYFEDLSGGQKQKVGMALSLVNRPELVFLDEPTTGLDPQARRAVWEVIRALKTGGKSVMLTTHYLEEAEQLADQVAIMDKGKIVASGTPNEMISRYGSGERLEVRAGKELADFIQTNAKLSVSYQGSQQGGQGVVTILLKQKDDAFIAMGAIQESGVPWTELATARDTLEDVFVKLVGGPLGEQGEVAGVSKKAR